MSYVRVPPVLPWKLLCLPASWRAWWGGPTFLHSGQDTAETQEGCWKAFCAIQVYALCLAALLSLGVELSLTLWNCSKAQNKLLMFYSWDIGNVTGYVQTTKNKHSEFRHLTKSVLSWHKWKQAKVHSYVQNTYFLDIKLWFREMLINYTEKQYCELALG